MRRKALLFRANTKHSEVSASESPDFIRTSDIKNHADFWLTVCRNARPNNSGRTEGNRLLVVEKLIWYLNKIGADRCGLVELERFFDYLNNGHKEPGGRWGNPKNSKPPRPSTVRTYHGHLLSFWRFLVKRKVVSKSPFEIIERVDVPKDKIRPFTRDHKQALFRAAKSSAYPKRDTAILALLLDTGMRVSELCGIKWNDLDNENRRVSVLGKGNKRRTVVYGTRTAHAIHDYRRYETADDKIPLLPDTALFISDHGRSSGGALTRSGVLQLFRRLNKKARLKDVRASPHTCRHTFAVDFLRNGGSVMTLQEMLGHEHMQMVQRYVRLSQADVENLARPYSPMDNADFI